LKTPALLVSTSFSTQVLGLSDGERVWTVRTDAGRDHLASITRNLESLLVQSEIGRDGIVSVLADAGPGSFTGVRIGMSCGRTLSQALSVPIGCLTSVQALAAAGRRDGPVYGVKDAGRGRVYVAGWEFQGDAEPKILAGLSDAYPEEFFSSVPAGCFVCDSPELAERFRASGRDMRTMDAPEAEDFFRAARLFRVPFGTWREALPVYLRKSDAEMKRTP
jgi:tRNA threonylcarbamoyl adenosine modification protein YeaZ